MSNRKSEKKTGFPCLVETRLSQEKITELKEILKQSIGIRSMSELVRNILEGRPIAIRTYDGWSEELLKELTAIQKELQSISNNVNQITRRFHLEDSSEAKLYEALAVTEKYQQTELKIQEALSVIRKITEHRPKKWLKTQEVMEMLGMSEVTLQTLRNKKIIPFKKLGGICYYNIDELDRAIKEL